MPAFGRKRFADVLLVRIDVNGKGRNVESED